MRAIEAFNKVLVGVLFVLVLVQASLLFVMKNMKDQAQLRLVDNETQVDLKCGEATFAEENYWNPLARDYNAIRTCAGWDCEKSALTWSDTSHEKSLHVVSVKNAPPMRWNEQDAGGSIRVNVPASDKPQVLALSSQNMHEWKLIVDKNAKLEKIIVATPTVVWIDGAPETTKIEYLPKEKMCSYPYAWEEAHNPDNEFRVLLGALKKITGQWPSSFQGAVTGRDFVVPKADDLGRRSIASIDDRKPITLSPSHIVWTRSQDRVAPQEAKLAGVSAAAVQFPEKTDAVAGVFILRKQRLHVWDVEKKTYVPVEVPLQLPPIDAVTALSADSTNPHRAFVFNEGNGGEVYAYDHASKKWELLKEGISSAVRSLHYDAQDKKLYGLVSRGRQFTDVLEFTCGDGAVETCAKLDAAKKALVTGIPFDPVRWKWEMVQQNGALAVVLHTPLEPAGEIHPLSF